MVKGKKNTMQEKLTAEQTLQIMLDFYPDIFPTRGHALAHLFFTIGNGFGWDNGALVRNYYGDATSRYKITEKIERATGELENQYLETHDNEKLRTIFSTLEQRVSAYYSRLYCVITRPNKDFSYLYVYPKNIRPDWKKLREEAEFLLNDKRYMLMGSEELIAVTDAMKTKIYDEEKLKFLL